jgi:hypothetical protein
VKKCFVALQYKHGQADCPRLLYAIVASSVRGSHLLSIQTICAFSPAFAPANWN